MKRSEVRAFLKSGVDALAQSIKFNAGRITEFNSNRSNTYPFIWLETLKSTPGINPDTGLTTENWAVALHIANKDSAGSLPEQYEAIVDECDYLGQQLTGQYTHSLATSKLMVLEGIDRDPFIHKHADDTTGIILTFTLIDFSPTDVC